MLNRFRLNRRQYTRALAAFVGLPVATFFALFFLLAAFDRLSEVVYLFFLGMPLLAFWCFLAIAITTCARALDAGYPQPLGIPIAFLLLASLTPSHYGQPLFYAGVAGLAFALAVPSAPAGGRRRVYWAEYASLLCLTLLSLDAALNTLDYALSRLGGLTSFKRELLGPDVGLAIRSWLMPSVSAAFIALLITLLWRAQPHRAMAPPE